MDLILLNAHASVANFEHVNVVPTTGTSVLLIVMSLHRLALFNSRDKTYLGSSDGLIDNVDHGVPVVGDISGRSPTVTYFLYRPD